MIRRSGWRDGKPSTQANASISACGHHVKTHLNRPISFATSLLLKALRALPASQWFSGELHKFWGGWSGFVVVVKSDEDFGHKLRRNPRLCLAADVRFRASIFCPCPMDGWFFTFSERGRRTWVDHQSDSNENRQKTHPKDPPKKIVNSPPEARLLVCPPQQLTPVPPPFGLVQRHHKGHAGIGTDTCPMVRLVCPPAIDPSTTTFRIGTGPQCFWRNWGTTWPQYHHLPDWYERRPDGRHRQVYTPGHHYGGVRRVTVQKKWSPRCSKAWALQSCRPQRRTITSGDPTAPSRWRCTPRNWRTWHARTAWCTCSWNIPRSQADWSSWWLSGQRRSRRHHPWKPSGRSCPLTRTCFPAPTPRASAHSRSRQTPRRNPPSLRAPKLEVTTFRIGTAAPPRACRNWHRHMPHGPFGLPPSNWPLYHHLPDWYGATMLLAKLR